MSTATIQNNYYVRNFPTEVPMKAAQGFIATAVVNLMVGSAANVALIGGALAVTATLIEAVTRPIIRAVFPQNPLIARIIQIIVPQALAFGLGVAAAPWIGLSYKLSSSIIGFIAWLVLNDGWYNRNVGLVHVL